jgi:hypothetical protein
MPAQKRLTVPVECIYAGQVGEAPIEVGLQVVDEGQYQTASPIARGPFKEGSEKTGLPRAGPGDDELPLTLRLEDSLDRITQLRRHVVVNLRERGFAADIL